MKKTEYSEVVVKNAEDRQLELDSGKKDDSTLPQFSKEVPLSTKKRDNGDSTIVEHNWKNSRCESIRVKEITFLKGEQLDTIYMINARDGADSASLVHNNQVYIFRKTTKEVAKAICTMCAKAREGIENVVGWLISVLGNVYIISRVDRLCWSFDKRLSKNLNFSSPDSLSGPQKKALCDMVIQNIANLHSRGMVLGRFTLNSVLLMNDDMRFTDLRGLRPARKLSFGVEEFKAVMQYLFALGMVKPEDQYYTIAMYNVLNEPGCRQWYEEKIGKKAKETLEITTCMEDDIY